MEAGNLACLGWGGQKQPSACVKKQVVCKGGETHAFWVAQRPAKGDVGSADNSLRKHGGEGG